MAIDRNTAIKSSQILKHTLQQDDLSPDALVWQEPVIDKDLTTPPGSPNEGDRYFIGTVGFTWNIINEDCADISDWSDLDTGGGYGESTQVSFDSKTCFKFDGQLAQLNSYAMRRITSPSIPAIYTMELNLYCDNIGGDNDNCFHISAYNSANSHALLIDFRSNGLFIHDGDTYNEVDTDLVQQDVWQLWRFEVTTTTPSTATCDVYLNDELKASNVDCSLVEAGNEITLNIQNDSTANLIAYIDYFKIGTGLAGGWFNHDNKIAQYVNSVWNYYTPLEGWRFYIKDENKNYEYNGSSLQEIGTAANIKDAIDKKHTQNTDTALGAQSENLDMNTHKIVGVVDPTTDQEVATKKYVDDNAGGITVDDIDDFTIKLENNKLKVADRIETNIMLNAFRIAINGSLSIFDMVDGFVDEFEDETGVDTVNSVNEDYDSVNDLYKPIASSALELDYMEYATDGAAQAAYVTSDPGGYGSDVTSGETFSASTERDGYPVGNMFDDNVTTTWMSSSGSVTNQWVRVQFASSKIITKIRMYKNDTFTAKHCKLEGSNNGSDWTKISATGWDGTEFQQYNTDEWIIASDVGDAWGWVTFSNSTSYTYYRVFITDAWHITYIRFGELEMMEGTVASLQSYSEATIKNQGTYSLKAIAAITDSLNETLTKSSLSIDLSGKNELKFWVYSSRTGTNLQMQIHDSGGTTSTKDIVISSADTWTEITWDISGISDANKDDIDSIIIKITNADSANTFYVDNFYASGLTNNMTLLSNSEVAESVPSDARIVLFEEDVDSITENTDLKAYVSRDGGSTYAQVTLSDEGDYETGKRILTGIVDLTQSGIGSGTNMEYKIETLNNKGLKLHGIALHWD